MAAGAPAQLAGFIRLAHPFPSLLDGAVVVAVAMLAGADPASAVRLGLAMVALQASIGALNDLVDAQRDVGRVPAKPVPAGLVSPAAGRVFVVAGAIVGLALSAPSGFATLLLACLGLAIGYAYDLGFKGTAWSWLPFAVGIPLLPVYGWLGATGGLPGSFAILLPAAFTAGAGLAVANARADAERDAAAGVDSVALRLGLGRAWTVNVLLLAVVVGAALATLAGDGAASGARLAAIVAGVVIGLGAVVGRGGDPARRERAWELEAIGVGLPGRRVAGGRPSRATSAGASSRRRRSDQGDGVLQAELGDRQVLGEVRAVRGADRPAKLGTPEDAHDLVDRVDQTLLGVDQGVIRTARAAACRRRSTGRRARSRHRRPVRRPPPRASPSRRLAGVPVAPDGPRSCRAT